MTSPSREDTAVPRKEPFAARLHFVPRTMQPIQLRLVRALRRYFERAPGWVLLTTIGRKSGLPREVLLPCERMAGQLYVISTYGRRSNWIRNIERDPRVQVTSRGTQIQGQAEIVVDLATKRDLVGAHPFFVPLPVFPLNALHKTILRPFTAAFLRWWVKGRPLVVVRLPRS